MKTILLIIIALGLAQWWLKDPNIGGYDYVIKYSGSGSKDTNLPMLITLHGDGDTPDNFYNTALDQFKTPARIVMLKAPRPYGGGYAWPWDPAGVQEYGSTLSEAAKALTLKFPTSGKPVLMGFSGGGRMAYFQAMKHGNNYSYVFPVSGMLSKEYLGNNSSMPGAKVYAYHGKNDSVVSFGGGKNAAALLREGGVDVKFTAFDGDHHGIFRKMKPVITEAIEQKLNIL